VPELTAENTPEPAAKPTAAGPPGGTSVVRHYFRYLNAQLFNSIAGLISFPIMARLLSKEQFGILSYFELFPLVWIAFLKLGTQHSIIRFYPIYGQSEDVEKRRTFYASLVTVPGIISTGLCALSLVVLLLWHMWSPIENIHFLLLVLILGQLGVLGSLSDNIMRARELSKKSAGISIFGRYTDFVFVLGMVYLTHTALGYYTGKLFSSLILGGYMLWWLTHNCELNIRAFKPSIFRESLMFGLPLVISEISLILLAFADRLMLNKYLPGDARFVKEQLGVYGIGYTLAMYIGTFMRASLTSAYQPVANRLYQHHGTAAVRRFKHKLLKVLVYASLALMVGLLLAGKQVVHLFAGTDKLDAAPVFVWVGINYALMPIFNVAGYGLILTRKTSIIAWVVLVSAIINIILNFMLIPRMGIMGAVVATLVAYAFMGLYQIFKCPRELRSFPGWGEMAIPAGAAAAWWLVVEGIDKLGATAGLGKLIAHWGQIMPVGRLERMVSEGSISLAHLILVAMAFLVVYLIPCLGLDRDLQDELTKRIPALRRFARG
jgi:O-antigen/teichoic acid export membrane protein